VLERVVPVVVTERPLGAHLAGVHFTNKGELRTLNNRQLSDRVVEQPEPLAQDERGEEQLRHVLWQRRYRAEDQRWRAADSDVDRELLPQRLRRSEVVPSPFSDLAVEARRLVVVTLDAVHAEVVHLRLWVFGVHQRQRDERPAVERPGGDHRKPREARRLVNDQRKIKRLALEPDTREPGKGVPMVPYLREAGRHQGVRHRRDFAHQLLRPPAKGEVDPARRAEQVGDERKACALYPSEEQGGTTTLDDAPMDFGDLEVRIDFGRDLY